MSEAERAMVDAKFGWIMAENLSRDSVFMHLYEQVEINAADDEG